MNVNESLHCHYQISSPKLSLQLNEHVPLKVIIFLLTATAVGITPLDFSVPPNKSMRKPHYF